MMTTIIAYTLGLRLLFSAIYVACRVYTLYFSPRQEPVSVSEEVINQVKKRAKMKKTAPKKKVATKTAKKKTATKKPAVKSTKQKAQRNG